MCLILFSKYLNVDAEQDVNGCPGDADLSSLLQMVILCIDSPEKHFAKVLTKTTLTRQKTQNLFGNCLTLC